MFWLEPYRMTGIFNCIFQRYFYESSDDTQKSDGQYNPVGLIGFAYENAPSHFRLINAIEL